MLGIALFLLGAIGVFWLDVSSILIGLLIGPALIVFGIALLFHLWRSNRQSNANTVRHHSSRTVALGRIGAMLLLFVAVLATIATGISIKEAPRVDAFANYSDPLGGEPGVLLKYEPFERGMPDDAIAWRILYTTIGLDNEVTIATGLVIVPEEVPATPMPVVLWAHGTTGIEPKCGPTLLNEPLKSGSMLFPDSALDQGWAIVAPDYIGLGTTAPHPFLVRCRPGCPAT